MLDMCILKLSEDLARSKYLMVVPCCAPEEMSRVGADCNPGFYVMTREKGKKGEGRVSFVANGIATSSPTSRGRPEGKGMCLQSDLFSNRG